MLNTVLFDMGGTLEDIDSSKDTIDLATQGVAKILKKHGLDPRCNEVALWNKLNAGIASYKKFSEGFSLEKKPEEIWPDYYLKEFGFDHAVLSACAEELAGMWEITCFHRELRRGAAEMLEALRQRGYRMGIVSNNCSVDSVFDLLEQYGIRGYFEDVTVSCIVGYRKPNPAIFHIALRQMCVAAESCVYVGDTRSRDIIGAKQAGFGRAVLIESKLTQRNDSLMKSDTYEPDHCITEIGELVSYLDAQR